MTDIFEQLATPFPREEVLWRAQNLTKDGDKALALAYIDARAVMRRLDDVIGPENWQDHYVETARGRVICELSIRFGEDWITKSDGAGETDIEGDKGGISDAFKRAAVKWGIGRYLYALGNVWCPCESFSGNDGRKRWKRWAKDPWTCVSAAVMPKTMPRQDWTVEGEPGLQTGVKGAKTDDSDSPAEKARKYSERIIEQFQEAKRLDGVAGVWRRNEPVIERLKANYDDLYQNVLDAYHARCEAIKESEAA